MTSTPKRRRSSAASAAATPPSPLADLASLKRALERAGPRAPRPERKSTKGAAAARAAAVRAEKLRQRYRHAADTLESELAQMRTLAVSAGLEPPRPPVQPAGPVPTVMRAPRPAGDDTRNSVGIEFARFIESVGLAMVQSQQQLDRESERYLRSEHPGGQPAIFRLPRLRAEARFDLEQTTGSNTNLVFYRRTGSDKEERSHSVEFEIVAVPPPPGFEASPIPAFRSLPLHRRKPDLEPALDVLRAEPDFGNDVRDSEKRVLAWQLDLGGAERLSMLGFGSADEGRAWWVLLDSGPRILARASHDRTRDPQLVQSLCQLSARQEAALG